MNRYWIAAICALLFVTPLAWEVAASYLFLWMAGLHGLVAQPWMAWWTYCDSGYHDFWTRLYLILSAAGPIVPLVIAAVIAARIYRARANRLPPLYGDSRFATDSDMRAGGVGRSRKFF